MVPLSLRFLFFLKLVIVVLSRKVFVVVIVLERVEKGDHEGVSPCFTYGENLYYNEGKADERQIGVMV